MQHARRPKPSAPVRVADGQPFDLAGFFPFQLAIASSVVARAFADGCASPSQVTPVEWRVLAVAGQHDGISATEVSRLAHLDKVKVSRAVAALTGRGLLRQTQNAGDKRARHLGLTRKGRAVLDRLVPEARAFEQAIAQRFSRQAFAELRATLGELAGGTARDPDMD